MTDDATTAPAEGVDATAKVDVEPEADTSVAEAATAADTETTDEVVEAAAPEAAAPEPVAEAPVETAAAGSLLARRWRTIQRRSMGSSSAAA